MKITNLNPEKYKRFFAFGCSFTNYKWLTWADIVGNDIEVYENWAVQGAGNHFIFNSVIEADARHNFNKDDLIIIFWSTKEREDRYHNNAWLNDTNLTQEKTYGKEWVKKFTLDFRSFLIRDLAYIKAIQTILMNKECDWANFAWNEFFNSGELRESFNTAKDKEPMLQMWREKSQQVYSGNDIANFFDDRDVIKIYQDVFTNINAVYKWYEAACVKNRLVPDNDNHPTPVEALKFLDWVWPNNTISDRTRKHVEYCESILFEKFDRPTRQPITRL
jgi:hypothetical protein